MSNKSLGKRQKIWNVLESLGHFSLSMHLIACCLSLHIRTLCCDNQVQVKVLAWDHYFYAVIMHLIACEAVKLTYPLSNYIKTDKVDRQEKQLFYQMSVTVCVYIQSPF